MLHLIPEDGQPHAPTTECGCGPSLVTATRDDGPPRPAMQHHSADEDTSAAELPE